MNRPEILDTAKGYVTQDRQADYDTPENSFGTIAKLWAAYKGVDFAPHEVAAMMALLKIARIKTTPGKADSWIDLAGYAACGGEIATEVKETTTILYREGSVSEAELRLQGLMEGIRAKP